ncbi:MAG: hypothetical protein B7Y12_16325 [Rhizobiales bacterium 24-66-13]|jgi:hypothetical protein|nr:MAG: hypothetical protein B7Y61_16810 [Rhizobiales bacterium 35-66-30]OYZ71821.1 MAG: hypothetical protein B7Y12_16325 [Rhizobiales bacterium 24-66-13]OZB10042.1 MAG: hypothetical protein B7X67_06525 [Rhizobiales bacterium 39-66-18]HQS45989.1 hypothetical protein [Xanthobacteraceae bacterium]
MRNLTLAALAIGAALTVSGAASADEYVTAMNKEAYAVAAESAREAQAAERSAIAPLGYAEAPTAGHSLNAIFPARSAQPTRTSQAEYSVGGTGE